MSGHIVLIVYYIYGSKCQERMVNIYKKLSGIWISKLLHKTALFVLFNNPKDLGCGVFMLHFTRLLCTIKNNSCIFDFFFSILLTNSRANDIVIQNFFSNIIRAGEDVQMQYGIF